MRKEPLWRIPSGWRDNPPMTQKKLATKGTKSTKVLCLLCLLCLLWLTPPLHAQATLEQTFSKMDDVAKTFRTVDATLERTKITVLVDEKDVASGRLYYLRAGK